MTTGKSPGVALLFSLLVPGLGQVYVSQPTKGIAIAGACSLLGGGMWWFSGLNRLSVVAVFILVWSSACVDAYKTAQIFGQPQDWYYRKSYVIPMLLLVGPLALPLLWHSSYFSRVARWGWTSFVTVVALLFFATPYLLSWLIRRIPELQTTLQQAGIQP